METLSPHPGSRLDPAPLTGWLKPRMFLEVWGLEPTVQAFGPPKVIDGGRFRDSLPNLTAPIKTEPCRHGVCCRPQVRTPPWSLWRSSSAGDPRWTGRLSSPGVEARRESGSGGCR